MIYSRLDGAGEMIKNNELWLAVEILRDLLSQKEAEADFFLREEIFYRLGRAFRLLEMEGDGGKEYFNSSRAWLESALMLSVDTPERESGIYIELGHLYLQRGGYERARTYLQEAARRAVLTSPESRVMALMTPQDILATEIYAKVETLFKQGALALETDQEKYRALGRMSGFYFTRAEALLKVYLPLELAFGTLPFDSVLVGSFNEAGRYLAGAREIRKDAPEVLSGLGRLWKNLGVTWRSGVYTKLA